MSDELIAEAEIGEVARAFVESELGKCVIGMAKQDVAAAQEELEVVDPADIEKVRKLQNKAALGRSLERYLVELITRGNNALETWRQQQHES